MQVARLGVLDVVEEAVAALAGVGGVELLDPGAGVGHQRRVLGDDDEAIRTDDGDEAQGRIVLLIGGGEASALGDGFEYVGGLRGLLVGEAEGLHDDAVEGGHVDDAEQGRGFVELCGGVDHDEQPAGGADDGGGGHDGGEDGRAGASGSAADELCGVEVSHASDADGGFGAFGEGAREHDRHVGRAEGGAVERADDEGVGAVFDDPAVERGERVEQVEHVGGGHLVVDVHGDRAGEIGVDDEVAAEVFLHDGSDDVAGRRLVEGEGESAEFAAAGAGRAGHGEFRAAAQRLGACREGAAVEQFGAFFAVDRGAGPEQLGDGSVAVVVGGGLLEGAGRFAEVRRGGLVGGAGGEGEAGRAQQRRGAGPPPRDLWRCARSSSVVVPISHRSLHARNHVRRSRRSREAVAARSIAFPAALAARRASPSTSRTHPPGPPGVRGGDGGGRVCVRVRVRFRVGHQATPSLIAIMPTMRA